LAVTPETLPRKKQFPAAQQFISDYTAAVRISPNYEPLSDSVSPEQQLFFFHFLSFFQTCCCLETLERLTTLWLHQHLFLSFPYLFNDAAVNLSFSFRTPSNS